MSENKKVKMTENEVRIANALFEKCKENLGYLCARWRDEREFEDFNDYIADMKKECEGMEVTFLTGSKRPFGFTVAINDKTIQYYASFNNNGTVGWKRLV